MNSIWSLPIIGALLALSVIPSPAAAQGDRHLEFAMKSCAPAHVYKMSFVHKKSKAEYGVMLSNVSPSIPSIGVLKTKTINALTTGIVPANVTLKEIIAVTGTNGFPQKVTGNSLVRSKFAHAPLL